MGIFSSLFKPKYTKWQTYLETRPKPYHTITPFPNLKINRSYSQMNAKTYYRQYNESLKLIGTTKKPDVFFERYDFAITRLIGLIYMKKYVNIAELNMSLPEAVEKLIDNKQTFVTQLIDRSRNALEDKLTKLKTNASIQKNIDKFEAQFEPFYVEISTENINYITGIANYLRNIYK